MFYIYINNKTKYIYLQCRDLCSDKIIIILCQNFFITFVNPFANTCIQMEIKKRNKKKL